MIKNFKTIFKIAFVLLLFASKSEASLSSHPDIIKDTVFAGSNNTSLLHITNVGPTSILDYQLSADEPWISFSSTSGSINEGDSVEIEITYDVSNLQAGINNTNIYIGDPHHGPITIPAEIYFQATTDGKEKFLPNNPVSFLLKQNYPNPFNPTTRIVYSVPETQKVTIKVFNVLGNEIMTLVDGEKTKGSYSINLDMTGYPSGVYFYKIQTEKFSQTRKMVLNK